MKKRLFSLILAFALLLSAVPTVFAATHHEVVIDGVSTGSIRRKAMQKSTAR